MKEYKKNAAFTIVMILIIIVSVEIAGQMIVRMVSGAWIWQQTQEVFNVPEFIERVPDERVFTVHKSTFAMQYQYLFDEYGFRVDFLGKDSDFNFKNNHRSDNNIVLLGDSVPFGYNAKNFDTLNSQLYATLQRHGVKNHGIINAAIPSYSLHQAVYRYNYEIAGKFPVSTVVLQTLDPAPQLVKWGTEWTREKNWANNKLESQTSGSLAFLSSHSSSAYAISSVASMFRSGPDTLMDTTSTELREHFIEENQKDLKIMASLLRSDKAALVLLPANPATSYTKALAEGTGDPLMVAMDWLNTAMKDFADHNDNVYFFDVSAYFDEIGRDGLFIDDCCHLSVEGSRKQAEFLYAKLREEGLL